MLWCLQPFHLPAMGIPITEVSLMLRSISTSKSKNKTEFHLMCYCWSIFLRNQNEFIRKMHSNGLNRLEICSVGDLNRLFWLNYTKLFTFFSIEHYAIFHNKITYQGYSIFWPIYHLCIENAYVRMVPVIVALHILHWCDFSLCFHFRCFPQSITNLHWKKLPLWLQLNDYLPLL